MLQLEEESIRAMCQDVIAVKPDVVVTEKGISGKLKKHKNNSNLLSFLKIFCFRCCCSLFSSCWYISCTSYEKIG
jgi:hypothetical protein